MERFSKRPRPYGRGYDCVRRPACAGYLKFPWLVPISGLMERVRNLSRLRLGQSGQALVEYSLILALISVVAIAILGGFGEHIRNIFLSIIASLAAAGHGF